MAECARGFGGDGRRVVGAVSRVETTGLTEADHPLGLTAQQKVLNRCGGAATDGQGHRLGEWKPPQAPAHPLIAPILKLAQHRRDRH